MTITETITETVTSTSNETSTITETRYETLITTNIINITRTIEPEGCQVTPTPITAPSEYGLREDFPASSCLELRGYIGYASGYYYINNSNDIAVLMYCEMDKEVKGSRGLMRIANVNMTDDSQDCPGELQLLSTPKRTCQRGMTSSGCSSAVFSTNNITYNKVCGRIRAYQYSTPNAFYPFYKDQSIDLSGVYVDGVSLTNTRSDSQRQHIWTFAGALDEIVRSQLAFACPCTYNETTNDNIPIPDYVGEDYFCETGSRDKYSYRTFYTDDPLWDGAGCGENDLCCNRGEYFCKTFPESTNSDIELRLCANEWRSNEDTPIEIIELYVQ